MIPIPDDELEQAADLLENFSTHWETIKHDRGAQETLVKLIVARIWVRDGRVVAISLRPNYHITLGVDGKDGAESKTPTEEAGVLNEMGGSDGRGSRTGYLIFFLKTDKTRVESVA